MANEECLKNLKKAVFDLRSICEAIHNHWNLIDPIKLENKLYSLSMGIDSDRIDLIHNLESEDSND